jgi:hypothetical protein
MPPNNTSTVLVAGVALLAASLGYWTYTTSSGSDAGRSTIREIDDELDDGDFIAEVDVCAIFEKIFLELQRTFGQLMTQVQALQMQGQTIPEGQLKGLIRQELERALLAKQSAIIEAAGIDADCLEEAVWEFLEDGNESVKFAVERVQKVWQNATGEAVLGWRPGKAAIVEEPLSAEKTIEAAEVYFNALTETMRTLVAQFKSDGKDLQSPAVQRELNAEFAKAANDAGEEALNDLEGGVTQTQFEASVQEHGQNPEVGRALAMMQMKQQQEFASMQTD